MLTLIHLLLITSVTLIFIGIFSSGNLIKRRRFALPEEQKQPRNLTKHIFFLLPVISKFLEKSKLDVKIKYKLDAARVNLTPQQFVAMKLALIQLAGAVAFFFISKSNPMVLAGGIFAGYIIPDIWLSRKAAQRRYSIARVLPETVDLLGLCVEAGLDFTTAVKWIIEKKVFSNPMIEELTLVLEEIKWGKPRSQALKDMARRLNISEVSSFVQALVQAERMGTPVSETFANISEDTRLQRYRRGERYALQAPIKILIPLIFCILPVIGIIIGGPILLQFMKGGLTSGLVK